MVDPERPDSEGSRLTIEQRAEHARRIEPGHAQPVDRAVEGDQCAGVAVREERVVSDRRERGRHRGTLSARASRSDAGGICGRYPRYARSSVAYGSHMVVHRDELISAQYFLAVAGVAAMRRILISPSAVLPRLEDARRVIGALDEFPNNIRIPVVEYEVSEGYDAWAAIYDSGPNAATELDTVLVPDASRLTSSWTGAGRRVRNRTANADADRTRPRRRGDRPERDHAHDRP